ncbi:MAG TPA: integration host factor, actinobacterial type [Micromonosporaceae bacterium]
MPLPTLSDEQRRAALEKAAEIRKARSELKEQLKSGKTTLTTVLHRAESEEMVGKLRVSELLQAMPGIGKVKAVQIMDRLKISETRRLRGLGNQQRRALIEEFSVDGH